MSNEAQEFAPHGKSTVKLTSEASQNCKMRVDCAIVLAMLSIMRNAHETASSRIEAAYGILGMGAEMMGFIDD